MDGNNVSSDRIIAEMVEMGFEYSNILEAIKVVGPSITSAVDHILNSSSSSTATCEASTTHSSKFHPLVGPSITSAVDHILNSSSSSTATCEASTTHSSKFHPLNGKALKKRAFPLSRSVQRSRILDRFQSSDAVVDVEEHKEPFPKMGVDHSVISDGVKHILNSSSSSTTTATTCEASTTHSSKSHPHNGKPLKKRALLLSRPVRQSRILDHFQTNDVVVVDVEEHKEPLPQMRVDHSVISEPFVAHDLDVASDWEQRVDNLLPKHFGFSSLKRFQKEALASWFAHKDCLVLAATGSGKSLCFQIPALLTGKVVVVISPLISLMQDQCLKLARHGFSACFLGSGQPDNTVEKKAMRGMYSIIYVCPETILRLIEPLQKLAESHGIALFGIDEVHCVSKWGHDFRPDYRRLSVLRENFSASKLKSLKFDIPLLALTATATKRVREDILKSLGMSKETNIVLTSFFRPNLRFMVKHSGTSPACYAKDFHELITVYGRRQNINGNKKAFISNDSDDVSNSFDASRMSDTNGVSPYEVDDDQDDYADSDFPGVVDDDQDDYAYRGIDVMHSGNTESFIEGKELSIDFLENDVDVFQNVDDPLNVAGGKFYGQPPPKVRKLSETINPPLSREGRLKFLKEPLERGPALIYVPTRKETLRIATYLCKFGVKAAAYNAGLPRSHLRKVHKEFHENTLEVVVATVAFGMGIDKSNVRRIIHYGWPQSLEAYYQEAGRAGRDGKLAECILYANLARIPSLLPSRRSEDQMKQAYIMLSDCFRYGMNTSCCRAKTLVEYFGEDFSHQKCLLCDVCVDGPPQRQNLKEEACILLQTIGAHNACHHSMDCSYDDDIHFEFKGARLGNRPSLKILVGKIREQFQKFLTTDIPWWRGLARILEVKGYIREGGDQLHHVQIKYPELTELGLEFVKSTSEPAFYVYPEADMLLARKTQKPFSSFSEWGRGWADPVIRRQRLERMQLNKKPRKRQSPRKRKGKKVQPDMRTSRGRLQAKLAKHK